MASPQPPMVGDSRSVSYEDPSARQVAGVTLVISDDDPNGEDHEFWRSDEQKTARQWLQEKMKELPPQDEIEIHDAGLGMGRRHPIMLEDPMSSLRIFERQPGSIKIQVQGAEHSGIVTTDDRRRRAAKQKAEA